MMRGDCLDLLVIYEDPTDFPGRFVVRAHVVDGQGTRPKPDPEAIVDTLEQARKSVPFGKVNLGRMPEDDPKIVEVWL